jgi:hypothetical protein
MLTGEFGVVYMMLVCRHADYKSYRVMEASTRIPTGSPGRLGSA